MTETDTPGMHMETADAFMRRYQEAANSGDFSAVIEMLSEDAVYWFSDGSYRGPKQIRRAFERTWSTIHDEVYTIGDIEWMCESEDCAVCIYAFSSTGRIDEKLTSFKGRGTNVLRKSDRGWKIVHEHLSLTE